MNGIIEPKNQENQCCEKCKFIVRNGFQEIIDIVCRVLDCPCHQSKPQEKPKGEIEDWDKEEWCGWAIVDRMLESPDAVGIYPTSQCYKELYEFVIAQKQKARQETKKKVIEIIDNAIKIRKVFPVQITEKNDKLADKVNEFINQALQEAIQKIEKI